MHPKVVRHLVSPLLERALGRRTFQYLRELREGQWLSAHDLREVQRSKLRTLFELSNRHCPYYADLFRDCGVDVAADDPLEALHRLPLLDKPTIRENLDSMTNHEVPGGAIRFNTGGSTGEPLVFFVDQRRIGYDKAGRMLTHEWFGACPGSKEVYLWGSPVELTVQDHARRFRDRLTNELLLDAFDLSPETMAAYIARINEFDPTSVFGYPSSLSTLAAYCSSEGLQFVGKALRAVFVTGELLDDHQRKVLECFFGARVVNCYGSRDGGFIAHDCPHGRMHVLDQNVIVEIVDSRGVTVEDGVSGEIVITHLDAWATPLIRYRTGDMGSLEIGECPCGRQMRTLGMVAGRRTDQLVASDGTLKHALSAIYVLRELDTVAQFHIHQQRNRDVDVLVVPASGFGDRERGAIVQGLKRQLGNGVHVRVQEVGSIDSARSGKFRYVVSEAGEQSAEEMASSNDTCPTGTNAVLI